MTRLIVATLAAFTAAALGTTLSSANAAGAGGCAPWVCGSNGRDINGISRNGRDLQGVQLNGLRRNGVQVNGNMSEETAGHVVKTVILPTGEVVDLR
ncbi:MAG: hypothetical protein ACRED5_06760 [Propylenella sp.]